MSSNSLKNLLDNIEQGKPVNYLSLHQQIKKLRLDYDYQPSDISGKQVDGKKYIIEYINPVLLDLLKASAVHASNRIRAAQQNKSHNHKVGGSYLLVRPQNTHPIVLLFDELGIQTPSDFPHGSTLLVVENRELFLNPVATHDFITNHCHISLGGFDMVLGNGMEINNTLHRDFLNQYQCVFLLTDMDLGGLLIAQSVFRLANKTKVHFLYPSDIENRLAKVVEKPAKDYMRLIRDIARQTPQLIPIANILLKHNRFLEQESYIC